MGGGKGKSDLRRTAARGCGGGENYEPDEKKRVSVG